MGRAFSLFRAFDGKLGAEWLNATPAVREAFEVIADAHNYRREEEAERMKEQMS